MHATLAHFCRDCSVQLLCNCCRPGEVEGCQEVTRVCRLARRLMQQYCAAILRLQRGQPQESAGSQMQADGQMHQPGTGKLLLWLSCYITLRTTCMSSTWAYSHSHMQRPILG